jgi:ribosomal protein S18 acetylase RimI-like enzyme
MSVRSFQLSDFSPVIALLEDVLSAPCYEETMEAFARQLSWDGDMILVAEENDEVIGVAIGTIDNQQGVVYRVAVSSEHRGKGTGSKLVDGLKHRFEQRKIRKIMVNIDSYSERVVSFFESIGYREADFFRSSNRLSIVKKAAF